VALGHGGDEGGVEPAGEDTERDVSHVPLENCLQRAGIGHMARSVSVTADAWDGSSLSKTVVSTLSF
jgi:hypothetical protein